MTDVLVKFCSSCGVPNRGTPFCASCGAPAIVGQSAAQSTAPTAPPPPPATTWVEPTRGDTLRWGSYQPRLLTAYGLIALATLTPLLAYVTSASALLIVLVVVLVAAVLAAFVVLPGRLGLRLCAAAIALIGLLGAAFDSPLFAGPAAIALTAAWFMARRRPGISYLFLIVAAILATAAAFSVRLILMQLAVVIAVWLGRLVAPAGDRAKARRTVVVLAQGAGSANTNTMALLALVFGVIGGTGIPIVLGHVALSQIRRTGEGGRGLAIAGLVLGYVGVGGLLIVGIVALFLTGRT